MLLLPVNYKITGFEFSIAAAFFDKIVFQLVNFKTRK